MAFLLQDLPQCLIVVYLAVEYNDKIAVSGGHGLGPACNIDDGQTPVPEKHPIALIRKKAVCIRPPVANGACHGMENIPGTYAYETGNAAHGDELILFNISDFLNQVNTFLLGFVIGAHDHFCQKPH